MGTCHDCKSFLSKTELSLGFPDISDPIVDPAPSKDFSVLKPIVSKLAALWRGFTERKAFTHIYKQAKPEYKYFEITEVLETLSKNIGLASYKESRKEYKFKQGKYTGEWCGGFRQGFGTMIWPDGCKYEGHWMYSRPYGSGKFIYKNGEGYQGDWKVYYIHSKSIFQTGRLEKWKDCVQDGYLWLWIMHHLDQAANQVVDEFGLISSRFEVMNKDFNLLKKNILKVEIVEVTEENSVYVGAVKNHKKHGFGKLNWTDGEYEGGFVNNMQQGVGKIVWKDGNSYFGGFFKDMREGVGEFKWKTGNKYLGEWKNNFMWGFGKYCWRDGKEYVGGWKNGERDGYGRMVYSDEKVFEGQFKADKPNGIGVLRNQDKETRGKWVNGKLEKKE